MNAKHKRGSSLSERDMFEPKAVAVHLKDVNVVGKTIEQRAG